MGGEGRSNSLCTGGGGGLGTNGLRSWLWTFNPAVACTVLWTRLIRDRRRRWLVLYAVAVVLLVAAHLLAASMDRRG